MAHLKLGRSSGTAGISGVHFYVTREKQFADTSDMAIITFDDERLNIGGAYDLKSGSFTAPKPGVYYFFFSGVIVNPAPSNNGFSFIFLYRGNDSTLSGGTIKMESAKEILTWPRDPVFQVTLQLKSGEKVQPKSSLSKGSSLYMCSFSGSLLEELHE